MHSVPQTTDQITKVILTGGSSKWWFLREIVAKEFALGGDRIFSTDTPFTDVATGCAASIGLSDQAPKKDGIWVKYRFSEKEPWSEAKCLLAPGRNNSMETTGIQYLCTIPETRYLHSWRIYLSWWHGFEKNALQPIPNEFEAAIDVFARSNIPFASRLRNVSAAFQGRPTERLNDEYKVYLQYLENDAGGRKYTFKIVDHAAAAYDAVVCTKGEEAARGMPKGYCYVGKIDPGEISYQGLLGFGSRKRKDYRTSKPGTNSAGPTSSSSTPWYRNISFLRKRK